MMIAEIVVIALGSAALVWLIDLCCRHEFAMLEQRARNGEANGLRGTDQGVVFHEKDNGR